MSKNAITQAVDAGSSVALPEAPAATKELGLLEFFDPSALPESIGIVIAATVGVVSLDILAVRASARYPTQRLLIKKFASIARFLVIGIAATAAILNLFVLSSQAVFAFAGTLGVLVGFGLKDLFGTMFAGASILLNRSFQVGDRIAFGGFYGEVLSIGMSKVKLQTLDDNLVSIPTVKIRDEIVANANAGNLDCMVVIPFYIGKNADFQLALTIVRDAVYSSMYVALHKPVDVLMATQLEEGIGSVFVVTAKAYVFDARFEKRMMSDVTQRVLGAFVEAEIPLA